MPDPVPAPGPLDADRLSVLRDAALSAARGLGCAHAELRVERIHSQRLALRDGRLEGAVDDTEIGMGLRVVADGAVGFAATVAVAAEDAAGLAERAVEAARTIAIAGGRPVELAPAGDQGTQSWTSRYEINPADVDLADKVARLADWSERLLGADGVDHVTAAVLAVCEDKYLAALSGTEATQRRVRVHPVAEAVALDADGGFETMRTLAPPAGRGWEYLAGTGWDWDAELAALPGLLAEKLHAPSVEAGRYDLVIDPTNLWLTIHESIGHATELDRAMGYEAAYAGTSFATFDRLGTLRYGSPVMHVTGDRVTPHGLATVAIDDEGVPAQTFDLVRDGVLVGYQLDRSIAATSGLGASNGCAFARLAHARPHPADGQRLAPARRRGRPDHRGAHRRRRRRHLHPG